eukprot:scaffold15647_cov119-Skeletonema_marinoi.AAC.1
MERPHRGANGQHHSTNDPDDTFDNDSSTAMSLDESSIQLNATAASHNISVDMTGTSFSRRGGGYGGGRRSNASAGLLTSPAFSPFGGADDSTAMSISGMDYTPSSHQMMRGNVNGGQHNSNDNFGPNKSSDIH